MREGEKIISPDTIQRKNIQEANDIVSVYMDDVKNSGRPINVIITFGNAYGKQMKRTFELFKLLTKQKCHVIILVIDPLFAKDETWTSFLFNLNKISNSDKLTIDPINFENDDSMNGCLLIYDNEENRGNGEGIVIFISEGFPTQYKEYSVEFTEQIISKKSLEYADKCKPKDDYPFNSWKPILEDALSTKGQVIIDNDAWHQSKGILGRNQKIKSVYENRYMEWYCEILYILRQMKNPNIKFVHSHSITSNVSLNDLKPLDAKFVPESYVSSSSTIGGRRKTRRGKSSLRKKSRKQVRG
jgi:hypothetical protein